MGLLDTLFGSSSSQKQKSKSTTEQEQVSEVRSEQDQSTLSTQTGLETTDATQKQAVTQSLLGEKETAALSKILLQLSGTSGTGGGTLDPEISGGISNLSELAALLNEDAGAIQADELSQIEAIVNEARRTGLNQIESNLTTTGEAAGSNLNSIIQAANAQGESDLVTQLAALESELTLGISGRAFDRKTAAFGAGAEALKTGANVDLASKQTGIANIAQIADILKGASSETLTDQISSQQVGSEEQLEEVIKQLIAATEQTAGKSSSTTKGKTSGGTSGSILNPISLSGVLFNPR